MTKKQVFLALVVVVLWGMVAYRSLVEAPAVVKPVQETALPIQKVVKEEEAIVVPSALPAAPLVEEAPEIKEKRARREEAMEEMSGQWGGMSEEDHADMCEIMRERCDSKPKPNVYCKTVSVKCE